LLHLGRLVHLRVCVMVRPRCLRVVAIPVEIRYGVLHEEFQILFPITFSTLLGAVVVSHHAKLFKSGFQSVAWWCAVWEALPSHARGLCQAPWRDRSANCCCHNGIVCCHLQEVDTAALKG
jgi:hypothetical protein